MKENASIQIQKNVQILKKICLSGAIFASAFMPGDGGVYQYYLN